MKDELVDADLENSISPNNAVNKFVLISSLTIIAYFLLRVLRDKIPAGLIQLNNRKFNVIGFAIIIIITFNAILFPSILNRIKPEIPKLKVLLVTGLTLIFIEINFKVLQNLFLSSEGIFSNSISILYYSCLMGIYGMAVANIRISYLRKQKLLYPILILIAGIFTISKL